jgi:hypothetical protein
MNHLWDEVTMAAAMRETTGQSEWSRGRRIVFSRQTIVTLCVPDRGATVRNPKEMKLQAFAPVSE